MSQRHAVRTGQAPFRQWRNSNRDRFDAYHLLWRSLKIGANKVHPGIPLDVPFLFIHQALVTTSVRFCPRTCNSRPHIPNEGMAFRWKMRATYYTRMTLISRQDKRCILFFGAPCILHDVCVSLASALECFAIIRTDRRRQSELGAIEGRLESLY